MHASPLNASPVPGGAATTPLPARPVEVKIDAAPQSPPARVWVILPMYNEAGIAPGVAGDVAAFAGAHPEYRFIFVDDGSHDGTRDVLAREIRRAEHDRPELADRLRVIGYRANAGKGYAVGRAVAAVPGRDDEPVIFTDGDLAYSLDYLPVLVGALKEADVVIGSRWAPEGGYGAHLMRTAMGWTYNKLARVCLGANYRDTQAGLKGFRLGAARRIFGALRVSGFAFDVELLYLARRFGCRIAQVGVKVEDSHRHKPSKLSLLRDPRRMFLALAGIRLSGAMGQYERPETGRVPLALMSFDAEEFDLPNEIGRPIDPDRALAVGAEGMRCALDLLDEVPAQATFFVTGAFAAANPALVRDARLRGHEIASHAMTHTGFCDDDLGRSREVLEEIAGVPVRGFRRPRFAPTDPAKIAAAGYTYDSSVNPIWLPGRYNGWRFPRRVFRRRDLVEIPVSATPFIRWPLFWLSFKNSPPWLTRAATRSVLAADGYAALCFHTWELCDLSGFGLPAYVRRVDGRSMQSRLIRHLRWLSRRAQFVTYSDLERRNRECLWPFGPARPPAAAVSYQSPARAGA